MSGFDGFGEKLFAAAERARARHQTSELRIWSFDRAEAFVAFSFLWVLCCDPDPPRTMSLSQEELESCVDLLVSLILVLKPPGRPRLNPRDAEDLLARYNSLPSAERVEIGGMRVKAARLRLAAVDTVMQRQESEDVREAAAMIGWDRTRSLVALMLDFGEHLSSPRFPKFSP